MSRLHTYITVLVLCCCWQRTELRAVPLPEAKPVHIEVQLDGKESRAMYFWLTDLYTKKEKKVKAEYRGNGVEVFDFQLYHPLYDEIIPASNRRIPFYVEPGDSLIIRLGQNGKVQSYERKDGKPVLYEQLLRHDISNRLFYTAEDFVEDRKAAQFPDFVQNMTRKMNTALDSVSHVADRHHFTAAERNLARCNVQMQFALWIFEYAPFKASELISYSQHHNEGWQALPQQDATMSDIENVQNYCFMRSLPLNDSTCLASRFFPAFIQSYEHTQVLNSDQYLYYGDTPSDIARMDSAYIAKDLAITQSDRPSLFMDIALKRRHIELPPTEDDGSIHLQEVQVIGANLDQFYQKFGYSEYNPQEVVEKAWAHDVNLRGIISSLINHKKIKNYKRAKRIIKELGKDDAEREALMKAYEDSLKK